MEAQAASAKLTTRQIDNFSWRIYSLLCTTAFIEEAFNSLYSEQWQQAIESEFNSINAHNTWILVRHPSDCKVIGTKFVFKLKHSETPFTPVAKATFIRFILAIAAAWHLLIYQFDIETAFLNPGIDHVVYVEQPPHCKVKNRQEYVYLLNKALYGPKQSLLLWSNDLKKALLDLGFEQSMADESIFIYSKGTSYIIIIAVYVDDIFVLPASLYEIQFLFHSLLSKFKMHNLGPVKKFLGLDISRPISTGSVYLSQATSCRKILHKFNMANCNPIKTLSEPSTQYIDKSLIHSCSLQRILMLTLYSLRIM